MTTATETKPAPTSELFKTLKKAADEKEAARVALLADLDAAKRRLADAEATAVETTGKELSTAVASIAFEREMVGVLTAKIARAEAAAREAGSAVGQEARRLAEEQLKVNAADCEKAIRLADEGIAAAVAGLVTALEKRVLAVDAAEAHNAGARLYGVHAVACESTLAVLTRLTEAGPLRIEVARG